MAHSLSAKKRIRQSIKRRARTRARKEEIKDKLKGYQAALAKGDWKKAEAELRVVTKTLDQVAAKHTIHKNAASRKRSRLTRHLNAARAAKPAAAKTGAGTKAATK